MSSEAPSSSPRYMGGQAVVEGVMMRGARTWAVAVRTPEGEIEIETHETPTWAEKWSKIPLVRGVMALAESLALGLEGAHVVGQPPDPRGGADLLQGDGLDDRRRAHVLHRHLHRAARGRRQRPRRRPRPRRLLVPRRRRRAAPRRSSSATSLLIGQLKDIKRVFQYHGAEHKAIAAYENDVELTRRVGAAVQHVARALRHQLPAHGDGRSPSSCTRSSAVPAGRCSSCPGSCCCRSSPA